MNRPLSASLVLAVVLILPSSCGRVSRAGFDEPEEITFETSRVAKASVTNELLLPGELEGYFETGIRAKVNGYVQRVLVDIGDKVSKDQLLAELEAPELTSQVAAAMSEFKSREAVFLNAKSKFVRLHQTSQTAGAVSPYDLEQEKSTFVSDSLLTDAAKAHYTAVRSLYNYLQITAPISGVITERNVAPGAFVGPDQKNEQPLFQLKREDKLRLHVAVPEKHLAEVNLGDLVTFTVESFPDRKFQGKITRAEKNLSEHTRAEIIEIEVENKTLELLPGMFAKAVIPIRRPEPTLVVPKTAVVTTMERRFVIKILHQTKAQWVDVKSGELKGTRVEVFGHLMAGDTILNVASEEIKNGATLKTILVNRDSIP